LELKDFGGRLIHENHPTYLVAISIINVQCEKDIKPQNFLKKLKINLQWCQIMSFAM